MLNLKESPAEFKRILVGVDPSADAQYAFEQAIQRAKENNADLIITNIIERRDNNKSLILNKDFLHKNHANLEEEINDYRDQALADGVKNVETIVAQGNVGETIVGKVIPKSNADLLIVGSLDKTGVSKFFGSQAAYMAKYAPISVMVLRK